MSVIVYSPSWFFGIDALLQSVAVIVSLMLSMAAYRIYSIMRESKFLYFSVSFVLISFSYIVKILTDLFVYNRIMLEQRPMIDLVVHNFSAIEFVSLFGNLAHRFLLLLGFLMLIIILLDIFDRRVVFLLVYFTFIVSVFSAWSFILFQTTVTVFAGTLALYYLFNYIDNQKRVIFYSLLGFSLVFLAQISFMFTFFFERRMFVMGHMFQTIGFIMLFVTYWLVSRR